VQAILAARRLRELCLGPEVGDVAWALLLEAFAARLEGRMVALTSLGAGEGIPRSTAHRWTRWLLDRGLLSSHADPSDDRITLVELSEEAAERVRTYLANALSLSRWAA
jgi:DNA-binding MarR family transcriptional regulator